MTPSEAQTYLDNANGNLALAALYLACDKCDEDPDKHEIFHYAIVIARTLGLETPSPDDVAAKNRTL